MKLSYKSGNTEVNLEASYEEQFLWVSIAPATIALATIVLATFLSPAGYQAISSGLTYLTSILLSVLEYKYPILALFLDAYFSNKP